MAITVHCAKCQNPSTVDERFIGQRVRCKKCGAIFVIDPPPLPEPQDPFSLDFAELAAAPAAPAPAAPADKASKYKLPAATAAPPDAQLASVAAQTASFPTQAPLGSETPAQGRAYRAEPGLDAITPFALFAFVAATLVLGLMVMMQSYSSHPKNTPMGATVSHIWISVALINVFFFAIAAPMLLAGVWMTAKIFEFPLVDMPYLRACGAAALPSILILIAASFSGPAAWFFWIMTVPAMFYMVKLIFDLDWIGGSVGFVFAIASWLVGCLASNWILGLIVAGSIFTIMDQNAADAAKKSATVARNSTSGGGAGQTSDSGGNATDATDPGSPGNAAAVAAANKLAQFKQQVQTETAVDLTGKLREDMLPAVQKLQDQFEALRPTCANDPDFPVVGEMIDQFRQKVNGLVSGKIDNDIYLATAPDLGWYTGHYSRAKLGPEVSFKQWKFQPPADLIFDLASNENLPAGLMWQGPSGKLVIRAAPRNMAQPLQYRPEVSTQPGPVALATQKGLFLIQRDNVDVSSGLIDGVVFTRIASRDLSKDPLIQYVAPMDNQWLIVELSPSADPAAGAMLQRIFEASAQTFRLADPGEGRADPFAAGNILSHLASDHDRVLAIIKTQGPAAEDAVIKLLEKNDPQTRMDALDLLKSVGTRKSRTVLRKLVFDPDPVFQAADREVLKQIEDLPVGPPSGK